MERSPTPSGAPSSFCAPQLLPAHRRITWCRHGEVPYTLQHSPEPVSETRACPVTAHAVQEVRHGGLVRNLTV